MHIHFLLGEALWVKVNVVNTRNVKRHFKKNFYIKEEIAKNYVYFKKLIVNFYKLVKWKNIKINTISIQLYLK